MTPIRRAFARAMACAVLLASPAAAQTLTTGKVSTGSPTFTNDQNVPLQLDATGALKVTGGGGGSGGAVTQGTTPWVISGNSTANGSGNPIFTQVTNFPATQAISAASLPLPAGAATAANQTSEISALNVIAQRAVNFIDTSSTGVAAGATYTGTTRDAGANPAYTRFSAGVYSTQQATINLYACFDATCSIRTVTSTASIPANGFATVSSTLLSRYNQLTVVNGATAGSVSVLSSFTAN